MEPSAREQYDALTPEQQREVEAVLAPEVARGWIPKDSDIRAVIALVLGREDDSQDDA